MLKRALQWLGGQPAGIWTIRHVIAPLDRILYRRTGGRLVLTNRLLAPVLLLTTTGRRSGQARTTPVFYVRDGARIVICNVQAESERPSPWPFNLRANPVARVQVGAVRGVYRAHEATPEETERYWPRLLRNWPANREFYARTGARSIFVLEPSDTGA
jgi:deazaflavin-dependent oxidoreductase (nitroreductase family)